MVDSALVCHSCGLSYPFEPRFESCEKCQGPLDVEIDVRAAYKQLDSRAFECPGGNIWKFASLLPLKKHESAITLGEGGTPLVQHQRLNAMLGLPNLFIKNEASNPTWSFKDRLNSVNASLAVEFGYCNIVALSTGNHGASAAAYAAAAGIRSAVLLPKGTPDVFGHMVQAYGGAAILTEWQGRTRLLTHLVRDHGWYPSKSALPTPITNPFGLQGYKTIAYEIAADMHPGVPDYVFAPVGSGDALYGIFKGFSDLMQIGRIDRIPKLVACEALASNPVAIALHRASDHVSPVANPKTIAISISEGIASDHALRGLRGSGGFAVSAAETEIVDAMHVYASAGIAAESSSCVPLAAVRRLLAEGRIAGDAKVVLILTSAGIKWPDQLAALATPAVSIDPSPQLLDALLFGERTGECSRCAR